MVHSLFWHTPLCLAPRALRPWLADRGSLTARLRRAFPRLQVRVLHQAAQGPQTDERAPLALAARQTRLLCREVLLHQDGTPLVFARSSTPPAALAGGFRLLARAGSRPLGALLFADPTIARSPLAWRQLDRRHPLWRAAAAAVGPLPPRLWARRSVFFSRGDRLLVTEVFLPAVSLPQ